VTGAGKLGRQKYDEGAARAITSTLRELGYEEDRGASAVLECAGSFKLQHDTGKNLKTVVVFPNVTGGDAGGDGGADVGGLSLEDGAGGASFLPEKSPEHKIAYSSMNVFERMINSMCPSWSQKKGCVTEIEAIKKPLEELDSKLVSGTPLSASEQEFYDSVSASSLEEKLACVRGLMHKQVDDGKITAAERKTLLDQISEKLQGLTKDISEAERDGKKKRVENLKAAQEKARERKSKLENISPVSPHPLKNEDKIAKLRAELLPLLDVEEAAKGRLLTLKESQAVGRKDEILEEIAELEESSRGWYETDDCFEARVKASRTAWEATKRRSKKSKASKGAGGGGGGGGGAWNAPKATKWVTPGASKTAAAKPKGNKMPRGGGVFAAMMMDSDSD